MKAVNLVPEDARRSRGSSGRIPVRINPASFRLAHAVVGVMVIVIALIALRVLADNNVNDKRATLTALQAQVGTEQARAAKLSVYASFVQAAEQREDQVRDLAEQRFAWQRTLDQISRVMPATTSLTNLTASTTSVTGADAASSVPQGTSTSAADSGPTFTLTGCADTPNQNGVATLLRRLQLLTGVTNVGFESSTRQAGCGNSFDLALSFSPAGAAATSASSTAADNAPMTTTTPVAGAAGE